LSPLSPKIYNKIGPPTTNSLHHHKKSHPMISLPFQYPRQRVVAKRIDIVSSLSSLTLVSGCIVDDDDGVESSYEEQYYYY
jgi:hypothetical protein